MNVLIFAAGLGTRLRPLTDHTPKALVEVGGQPLLYHTLSKVISQGAKEVVVNVHHHGQQIIDYINSKEWPIPIHISDERTQLLDTGGGLKQAAPLFTDQAAPILIHNVDILSDADLAALYRQAATGEADAVLLVSARKTQRYLLFDADGTLKAWTNIATGEVRTPYEALCTSCLRPLAFAGIHVVTPTLLHYMEQWPAKFPIMDFYLTHCRDARIQGVKQDELHLLDVGKIDSLTQAEAFVAENNTPTK